MQIPAAWHPDPTGAHDHRWWDGERWTEHVADAGVASVDPLPDSREAATGTAGTTAADTPDTATPADETTTADATTDDAPDAGATRLLDATPGDEPADDVGDDRAVAEPTTVMGRVAEEPVPATTSATAQPTWGDTGWPQSTTVAPGTPAGASGLAITALVLGILSIPLGLILLGGLLGIAAIICGAIASSRAKRGLAGGRGIAVGGVISGVVGVVIAGIILVFALRIGVEMTRCLEETGGDQQLCMQRLERQLTERFTAGA